MQSDTFGAFTDYLRQKSYHSLFFARYGVDAWVFIKTMAQIFWNEWPFPFWILAILGGWWFRQKDPRAFAALGAVGLFHFFLSFNYGNEFNMNTAYRYLLPFYAITAVFAAGGMAWLWNHFVPTAIAKELWAKVCLCSLLALGLLFPHSHWKDLSQSTASWDYALNLLKPLPKGAAFEPAGDNQLFPLAFAIDAQGLRPDLKMLEWNGNFFPQAHEALREKPGLSKGQLEETWFKDGGGQLFLPVERTMPPPYVVEPYGLVYRLSSETTRKTLPVATDPQSWVRLRHLDVERNDLEAEETLSEYYLQEGIFSWTRGDREKALALAAEALNRGNDSVHTLLALSVLYGKMDEWNKSEAALTRVLELEPHSDMVYEDLGVLYGKKGMYQEALGYFAKAIRLNPSNSTARKYYQRLINLSGSWKTP